ncbi:MAG: catalase, partial [Oscillospiraceae bacterium]
LALRLHDDQNQCDLLFNSIPVGAASNFAEGEEFFKSKNRCTKTGLWDYSRLWAFAVKNPASLNFLFYLFSDLGTPSSLRTIEYYTYPLIRVEGDDVCAIKLRLIPSQREKPFSMYMAQELAGSDSDYLLRDIFRAVKENRVYFELGAQVIPQKLWNQQESDIFNPTIMWNSAEIPIVPLGVVTVEASVKNHLEDTEKTCFRIDNLCSGLYLPDREIFREGAKTMGELSKLRVGVPYSFDESKFSAAEIGNYKKDGVTLLKERMTDMGERESRRLLENIAESLKTLDGMTLEKVLLLITDLNFSFGRALMNLLEA